MAGYLTIQPLPAPSNFAIQLCSALPCFALLCLAVSVLTLHCILTVVMISYCCCCCCPASLPLHTRVLFAAFILPELRSSGHGDGCNVETSWIYHVCELSRYLVGMKHPDGQQMVSTSRFRRESKLDTIHVELARSICYARQPRVEHPLSPQPASPLPKPHSSNLPHTSSRRFFTGSLLPAILGSS